MCSNKVKVLHSGAIVLDNKVSCDGFYHLAEVRVQSHIHSDHMVDFSSSLSQEVIMTQATGRLLGEQFPALDSRANVHMIEPGQIKKINGYEIQLASAGHMLGAAQVRVGLPDGASLGYSGDFGWPLSEVISVDALVLDATYGNPESQRRFTQGEAQSALVDLVVGLLRNGPVHLQGTTGPIERALSLLTMADVLNNIPVIVSRKASYSISVHQDYGIAMPRTIVVADSEEARAAIEDGFYLRLWGLNSPSLSDGLYSGAAVRVTKYRTRKEPVEQLAERAYCVGISNHADFIETLEYVKQTGAQFVLIDGARARQSPMAAIRVAEVIRGELGVPCEVSSAEETKMWGE